MKVRGNNDPPPLDQGFTLIELLVVIIIIGILAAIAIPVLLAQRKKADEASAKSDLHQVAQYEEAFLSSQGSYGSFTSLASDGEVVKVSPGDTVTIVAFRGASGYCLSASQSPGVTWYYDSLAGGLQPLGSTGCPAMTTGAAGGSLTG